MSEEIKKEKGHFRRNWFFYILIAAALGFSGFLFVSKSVALKNQAMTFEAEKAKIMVQAQEAFQSNLQQQLVLMMKTLVWAVRGELTRGNQEQVNQYFNQLVKSEKIEEATFVDNKGVILLSSNKNNVGSFLATDYSDLVMEADEMSSIEQGDKRIVASPIMSLDSRMGTLILIYKPDHFHLENKVNLTVDTY